MLIKITFTYQCNCCRQEGNQPKWATSWLSASSSLYLRFYLTRFLDKSFPKQRKNENVFELIKNISIFGKYKCSHSRRE